MQQIIFTTELALSSPTEDAAHHDPSHATACSDTGAVLGDFLENMTSFDKVKNSDECVEYLDEEEEEPDHEEGMELSAYIVIVWVEFGIYFSIDEH